MGAWGTGIYANDIAEDVKSLCSEIFPFVTVDEGNNIIFREFNDLITLPIPDGECASFWFALSDWQWKHGILSETIRSQAMTLLEQGTGLIDWQEVENAASVRRRKSVLEQLKLQLESPMPERKIPKGKLAKPEHKAGDLFIFRTYSPPNDPTNFYWKKSCVSNHYLFKDPAIAGGEEFIIPPFDASEKYMAILCVGTRRVQHSIYLPELYDEHSVYAFYDYLSENKPTIQTLKTCGFLPYSIFYLRDFNKKLHEKIGWTYLFSMYNRLIKDPTIFSTFEKTHSFEETTRFYSLLDRKNYLYEVVGDCYDLNQVFRGFWEDKVRTEQLGKSIDNLLDINASNPTLLTPAEADLAYQKWAASLHKENKKEQ